jgi:integrase
VFALLAETGMRLGEALGLRIGEFVLGRGATAYVEIVPRSDNPNGARVKMMRPRRVYVGAELERLFADYLTDIACRAAESGIALTDKCPLLMNVARPPLLAALRETTVREKVTSLRRRGIGPPGCSTSRTPRERDGDFPAGPAERYGVSRGVGGHQLGHWRGARTPIPPRLRQRVSGVAAESFGPQLVPA